MTGLGTVKSARSELDHRRDGKVRQVSTQVTGIKQWLPELNSTVPVKGLRWFPFRRNGDPSCYEGVNVSSTSLHASHMMWNEKNVGVLRT